MAWSLLQPSSPDAQQEQALVIHGLVPLTAFSGQSLTHLQWKCVVFCP